MKFIKIIVPFLGLIDFIRCDKSIASPELSNQALKEISPYSHYTDLRKSTNQKDTVENIYYYYPVQSVPENDPDIDRSSVDQSIENEPSELYKRRKVKHRRGGKGNRKNRRKFEETGPKAERRAALRRTAASIQSVITYNDMIDSENST